MEHFYQNIDGFFDFQDLYSSAVQTFADGAHFVEVGAWKGTSAAYMAVEIINSGKIIKFDAVDTWLGSVEHMSGQFADQDAIEGRLYETFLSNTEPVKHVINPIRLSSVEASKLYNDNSLDFVFIDADHRYEAVKADIAAWSPKLKIGGFLGGHDYWWGDVNRAVNEAFGTPEIHRSSWMVRRLF